MKNQAQAPEAPEAETPELPFLDGEYLPNENRIVFSKPIKLAKGREISEVLITEPTAAALKGLNRMELLMMSDDAHKKLLPRISEPCITAAMFEQLSLRDSQKIMTVVTGFFVDPGELTT